MRWQSVVLILAACTHTAEHPPLPDADPDHPFPAPRTDLLPAVGADGTLEIATWNIENFPAMPGTAKIVADVIASLNLDIVVVEEIANEAAWSELVVRLRDYDMVLSTHQYSTGDYQKIGVLYRRDLITAGEMKLLFTNDGFNFPRPALSLPITVDGNPFELVGMHLKAGTGPDDRQRRQQAIVELDTHLRAQIDGGGEANVIVVGDYNQQIVVPDDRAILAPLLTAPDRYTVRTEAGATAGGETYLGFGGEWIDHITTTVGLDAKWSAATTSVVDVRTAVLGYTDFVSDHLPVVLVAPR